MTPADFMQALQALHFLRPAWLAALLALPVLAWLWRTRRRARSAWRDAVDPHLLPQLLHAGGDRRSRSALGLAALAYVIAVLALAGPSWRQSPQPLWQVRAPLVIALDLSSTTLASDMPPSRLAQARAKIASLLHERAGGQIALVAFAGDAFTVAPLTDDAANVALFLDALQPDVMPVDGQRADRAIAWSAQLLERAHAAGGDIVLLTDHADSAAIAAASTTARRGHRVSVIGLGTPSGAAYRRPGGEIASARLDASSLRKLAAAGQGRYVAMDTDDADLRALGLLDPRVAGSTSKGESGLAWLDEGYWLLPPLMLLALFAFRRQAGALAVLLAIGILPLQPAHATELWRRSDQAEHARIREGNEAYRRGEFAAAARRYAQVDNATADYNRGNALAKEGKYPQAIAAYDEALQHQPNMADALANKRAVEQAMKRKRPPGSRQGAQQNQKSGQNPQQDQGSPQGRSQAQQKPADSRRSRSDDNGEQQRDEGEQSKQSPSQPAKPADAQAQADRAQRERMQRALQQARTKPDKDAKDEARVEETPEQRERRLANEAWLKRIPDDPGGLLRAKFRLEYERRMLQGRPEE